MLKFLGAVASLAWLEWMGTFPKKGSAVLVLTALAAPLAAQPQPDLLTPPCRAPETDIASPGPLAQVAAVLQRKTTVRVLAIGSSSTVGIGASSQRTTYPAQFEEILERSLKGIDLEVINRGVSGEIAATTAERLKADVEALKPDLVLWQVGTNDAIRRVPVPEFEATVRNTVRWLKDGRADVVLVGLQYTPRLARDEQYGEIRLAIQRVAASENVLLVRRFDAMQFIARTKINLDMLSGDQFHLNDLGYHCMAEHVAQAIVTTLFLRRGPPPPP
jgi:lysophospholipase L1-like esterase